MITLCFRFPGGRYHATPWGHQVNEGLVEWPPSPWRLLRAFVSCGYTRLGWDGSIPEVASHLLKKLASVLPSYALPSATVAHTRHYMPQGVLDKGREKTALVLDTWAEVDGELSVRWPVELTDEERKLLDQMVASMNYLGRSESWVEGRCLSEDEFLPNCEPLETTSGLVSNTQEIVSLMAPMPPGDYQAWRTEQCPPIDTGKGKPKAAQVKAYEKKAAPYPIDLLDALQWDTAKWKKFGWSQPPASRLVQYCRPMHSLDCARKTAGVDPAARHDADLVLLALATPSRSLSALPTLARTLPQAELLHRALVSRSDKTAGSVVPELSGCDDEHKPLKGHAHAHVLPLDLDTDGHLDHVLLWAPMGFSTHALRAIRGLRQTWKKGGELSIAVVGQGVRREATNLPDDLNHYLAPSSEWINVTPFVPPRFVKKRGPNSPEGQVLAELRSRGLPEPIRMDIRPFPQSGDLPESQSHHFRHATRVRSRGGNPPPQDTGWFVHLTFSSPVEGPLCLGYASHFGLGLFVATVAMTS